MPWNTVYIRGRDDFQKAIISKLEKTWMQGSPEAKDDLVMFWLPHTNTLRSLKVAIGSKLIWKYRLQFITNLNNHLKPKKDRSSEFSDSETEMISKMVHLDKRTTQQNMSLLTMNKPTTHFVVGETEDFLSTNFPEIVKELDEIKELVKPLRHVDNDIIILSYLKDHSVRADLTRSHPRIIEVLITKNACRYLEDLFVASNENSHFRLSLENYVVDQLNK